MVWARYRPGIHRAASQGPSIEYARLPRLVRQAGQTDTRSRQDKMQRIGWAPLTFLVQPPKLRQGIAVVDGAWFEETAIRNPPGYAAPFYVTPSPFSTASTLIFCVPGRFACRLMATRGSSR